MTAIISLSDHKGLIVTSLEGGKSISSCRGKETEAQQGEMTSPTLKLLDLDSNLGLSDNQSQK